MGELNSDNHYIYYCVQESFRRNEVFLIVKKRVKNAEFGCNLKNNRMILVCFQGKQFNITVISQQSKSMPQTLMQKKLRLNGSMMMYKNF